MRYELVLEGQDAQQFATLEECYAARDALDPIPPYVILDHETEGHWTTVVDCMTQRSALKE